MKKLIITMLIVALYSCSSGSSSDAQANKAGDKATSSKTKKQKNGKKDEEIIINVEADKIYQGDAELAFRTTTILEADLESAVTSKASGIVLQIKVEVGDKVQAGDVLAVLESDLKHLSLDSAEANYQKSLHNYQRAQTLLKKGLANQESVDNLKFETRALKTNYQQAKMDLDFTKIKAPISGIITKRLIKKGNLIQLNTPVYEIVDFESLQAVINVPEDRWNLFKKNLEVNFKFTGINDTIKGHVLRVNPIVDSATGTFKVVMNIDENQQLARQLRPGLFGKTEIVLDRHKDTLLVSKNAVIREDETAYVYEINDDKTTSKRNIEIGYEMDDSLEILSGIELGKQVVTTGKNNVSEEAKIQVIEYND
jgi:membrane fusion protein (multidrug efflux system)